MNVEEAILSRKSVRKFLPTPVPRETVEEILRVAQRAPSGNNIQPWKVYVVAGEARERLCRDVYEAAEKEPEQHQAEYDYYPSNWFEPYATRRRVCGYGLYSALGIDRHDKAARERQMLRNYLFFDAPVGMFITLDRRLSTGSYMDTGMFIQNVMLAARAHGLHTCAQAAFAWYHDVIRRHLPIPPEEIVLCGIALGHEDPAAPENAFITERAALEEFTQFYGF
ncbi:nitroreductase [Tepidiphilus olei]|uniref:nitroreductase n=1 Tax=Tepidiphilus olei TaxID=2502184 RepID=UPI00115EF91F|nr:nitroreductase [Tepidiphilus olei]